jgi:GNAT superfamily N-acetyltransferase
MQLVIELERDPATRRRLQEALTARLPQWFGQDEPNRRYAAEAERLEGWVARVDGQPAGLILLRGHSAEQAEIHWLGVDPAHHRKGIGRALVAAVERRVRAERMRVLLVTTLHADVDYEPYRRTRSFYEALGFEYASSTREGSAGPTSDPLACYRKAL